MISVVTTRLTVVGIIFILNLENFNRDDLFFEGTSLLVDPGLHGSDCGEVGDEVGKPSGTCWLSKV